VLSDFSGGGWGISKERATLEYEGSVKIRLPVVWY
jgi:hypothetical protein